MYVYICIYKYICRDRERERHTYIRIVYVWSLLMPLGTSLLGYSPLLCQIEAFRSLETSNETTATRSRPRTDKRNHPSRRAPAGEM